MLGSTLELPVWLVVVTGLLALVALVDRMLVPSFRWMLRRRLNRAIEHLNQKLQLSIQPFKLAKRRALIDQILFDPEVIAAIDQHAIDKGIPRDHAQAKARRYAREIVPSFSTYTYFKVGTRLARGVSRMLYRVRLGFVDETALSRVDRSATVVFVINHRSNMDYILVTYMAAATSALSYAVGEWARVWGLQSLIRSMGAYFVRRDSGEPLYRKVLARYVQMSTAAGVTQAMFPEGGLTRDGALRPPKLGLLNYMVSGFDPHGVRDIVFVPVGLNYDRVLEDRLQTGAIDTADGEKPRFRFHPGILTKFLLHQAWLRITGRWHRFGYACVSFGGPVSLRGYLAQNDLDMRTLGAAERAAEIGKFGQMLMQRVGEVVPILPVSLVATTLLERPLDRQSSGMSGFELKGRVQALMDELEVRGGHIHIPRRDREYAVEVGLRMLVLRHLVVEKDGLYRTNSAELVLLRYYANAIAHLVHARPPARLAATRAPEPIVTPSRNLWEVCHDTRSARLHHTGLPRCGGRHRNRITSHRRPAALRRRLRHRHRAQPLRQSITHGPRQARTVRARGRDRQQYLDALRGRRLRLHPAAPESRLLGNDTRGEHDRRP